jgi:putative SOS response-associated peptidase YedK
MTARFFRRDIPWEAYTAETGLVAPTFDGHAIEPPEPQYNIAPSQPVPILRLSWPGVYWGEYAPHGAVVMSPAFWGLVPAWWTKPLSEKNFSTFNARAETIEESSAFAGAFRHNRCLVPASGFYAWSGPDGARTPFAVALKRRAWFCFAGIWSRAMIEGSEIDTFAIITCEPNDLMAGFGPSMPVILEAKDHGRWLDTGAHDPRALLKPYAYGEMHAWPAHPSVGNVRNQGPELTGDDA